jgi:hypothetical protein
MLRKLAAAQKFMLGNARLLERRLFDFLFRDGNRQQVLAALLAYQNVDGGFGNALEPDKRTATSQPIDQELGLRILDDVGFHPNVAQRVCDFLLTVTTPEGGVPFVLPTVRDAPRAGWWNTDEKNPPASINPTASIAGLLHKHSFHHPWLDQATAYCWQQIENRQFSFAHDFLCAMHFLENIPDQARAEHAFERLGTQLLESRQITYDPNASGYVYMPLFFAPSPQSLCRRLFDDATMQTHLDVLAQKQQEDGGWPISWTAVTPACELEYRGIVTINALKTLKAYGYEG